jgi:hypothetical protein
MEAKEIALFLLAVFAPVLVLAGFALFCLIRTRRRKPISEEEAFHLAAPDATLLPVHVPQGEAHPGIAITLTPPVRPGTSSDVSRETEKLTRLSEEEEPVSPKLASIPRSHAKTSLKDAA